MHLRGRCRDSCVAGACYIRGHCAPAPPALCVSRLARRHDHRPRLARRLCLDRLAPRPITPSPSRLLFVVGGMDMRERGWLRLLSRLPRARHARLGRRYGVVRETASSLAIRDLGTTTRAFARQAEPARAGRAPERQRRRSPSSPIAPHTSFRSSRPPARRSPLIAPTPLGIVSAHLIAKDIPAAPLRSAKARSASRHTVAFQCSFG
jgi:hypothetical protein